jgi:hypothetical protein
LVFSSALPAELESPCETVGKDFTRLVFFCGKLVFQEETLFTRLLRQHTPFTLPQRLQFSGRELMIFLFERLPTHKGLPTHSTPRGTAIDAYQILP